MKVIESRLGWIFVISFIGLIGMSWGSMYYCAQTIKGDSGIGCAFIPDIPAQPTLLLLDEIAVIWTDKLVPYNDSYKYLSLEFIAYRNEWDTVRGRFDKNLLFLGYLVNAVAVYFIGFGIEKMKRGLNKKDVYGREIG